MPAASYANAKRILKNSNAKISQSPEGIFDQNAVVLFWDNIEARFINECVNYLNDLNEQPLLAGPTQFYDTLFEESLYHLHAYYDEDADRPDPSQRQQRIYRIMMRNPVAYSADNWGETSTRWKLETGSTATNGPSSTLVLSMANVTVEAALSFELQPLEDSYTDAIYLLRGILLQGEWFSRRRRSEVNAKTGLYTLYWYLTKSDVNELYYRFSSGPHTITGHYFLWDATSAKIGEILKETLFSYSTGDITAFPARLYPSGINIGELLVSPILLIAESSPSDIAYRDEAENIYVFKSGSDWVIYSTNPTSRVLYRCSTADPALIVPPISGWVTELGAGSNLTLGRGAGYPDVATLSEKVVGRSVIKRMFSRDSEDLLFDAEFEIRWETGTSEAIVLASKVILHGNNINPTAATGACKTHFDDTLVTWESLKALYDEYRGINYEATFLLDNVELVTLVGKNATELECKINQFGVTAAAIEDLFSNRLFVPNGEIHQI
jgi:hypothetical protein